MPAIALTARAADRARYLVETQGKGALGIRLAVRTRGCSGLTYTLDFAREIGEGDLVVEHDGLRFIVDRAALGYVEGTEIDYVEDRLGAQFVFHNPNEKARCGCGESFTV